MTKKHLIEMQNRNDATKNIARDDARCAPDFGRKAYESWWYLDNYIFEKINAENIEKLNDDLNEREDKDSVENSDTVIDVSFVECSDRSGER